MTVSALDDVLNEIINPFFEAAAQCESHNLSRGELLSVAMRVTRAYDAEIEQRESEENGNRKWAKDFLQMAFACEFTFRHDEQLRKRAEGLDPNLPESWQQEEITRCALRFAMKPTNAEGNYGSGVGVAYIFPEEFSRHALETLFEEMDNVYGPMRPGSDINGFAPVRYWKGIDERRRENKEDERLRQEHS